MLCDSMGIGGAETHILTLANALCTIGHEVTLISEGGMYEKKLYKDIRLYHLPITNKALAFITLLRLAKIFAKEKFDVIHAHTRLTAFYCRFLAKEKTVTTAHWVFSTGFPKRVLTYWGQKTLAVSEDIALYLHKQYDLPKRNIHITVNGIDESAFFSKKRKSEKVVCLCSRLDKERADAAFSLLRVAASLSEKYSFSLHIIGDGDAYEAINTLATTLQREHPHFRPILYGKRTDVPLLLAESDIFVGVSRAALEAMAAECAVILAGNEGYLSVFDPEKAREAERSNFCCRDTVPLSDTALKKDLAALLSLPKHILAEMGRANRQYVSRVYTVKRMVKDALTVYEACRKEKAVLCGYYGFGNVGDALLLASLRHRLLKEGYRRVLPLSKKLLSPSALYALWKGYDFFLGGGNLLQDQTGKRSLFFYLFFLRLAQKRGCRTAIISGGIGPLSAQGRKKAALALARLDTAECRTLSDKNEVKALGAKTAFFRADAALFLPFPQKKKEGKSILLAFRAPKEPNKEKYVFSVVKDICRIFSEEKILFFAMHPSDVSFGQRLCASFSISFYKGNASSFLGALRGCAMVLGDRLHAGICAFAMDIPFFLDEQDLKCRRFLLDVKKAADKGGFCGGLYPIPSTIPSCEEMETARKRFFMLT